jgi:serine/threonine-protein kinase HipA
MAQVERFVTIELPGERGSVPAGRLNMQEVGANTEFSRFSYGLRYVDRPNAMSVDPVSLPLAGQLIDVAPYGGLELFGALRDATPDYWGRRVIENKLRAVPGSLPESVFLDHAGPHRVGALDVQKEQNGVPLPSALPKQVELEYLMEAADRVEEGVPVPAQLEYFFTGAPSLGGARPKALVVDQGYQWIAKFPARGDALDMSWIEFATLNLARKAGLNVPPLRLVELPGKRNVMLIQRFDRRSEADSFSKIHMISALTAMGLHEQQSHTSSYADVARAVEQFGAVGAVEDDRIELFKRMIFNILVSNDDDHLRNHAFLYDAKNRGWRLSPLYDVVPRPSSAYERFLHLSVGPEGRASTLMNALRGCGQFGLTHSHAAALIDGVASVTREWMGYFEEAGVPGPEIEKVQSAFRRPSDIGMAEVMKVL